MLPLVTGFGIPKSPLKAVDLGGKRRDFQQMPDTHDPRVLLFSARDNRDMFFHQRMN